MIALRRFARAVDRAIWQSRGADIVCGAVVVAALGYITWLVYSLFGTRGVNP